MNYTWSEGNESVQVFISQSLNVLNVLYTCVTCENAKVAVLTSGPGEVAKKQN